MTKSLIVLSAVVIASVWARPTNFNEGDLERFMGAKGLKADRVEEDTKEGSGEEGDVIKYEGSSGEGSDDEAIEVEAPKAEAVKEEDKQVQSDLLDLIDKEELLNKKVMAELEDTAGPLAEAVRDELDSGVQDFPNADKVMEGDGDYSSGDSPEDEVKDEGDDTDVNEDEANNAVHRQRRSNKNNQSMKEAEGQLLDTMDKEESLNDKAMAELEDMAEPMADAVKDLEIEKENFPTADRVMEEDESSGDPPEDEVTDSGEQPPADAVRDRMDQGLRYLPNAGRVMEGEESSGASGDKGEDDADDDPNNAVQRQRRSNENDQYLKQTESELFDLTDNEETLNNKAMAELEDTAEPMADAVKDRDDLKFGDPEGGDGVVLENDEAEDFKRLQSDQDGVEEVEIVDMNTEEMNDEVDMIDGPVNDEGVPLFDEGAFNDEGVVVEGEEVGEPLNDEEGVVGREVEEGEGETPENDEDQVIEGGEGNDTPDVTTW